MTGALYYEDFEVGACRRHWPQKTVTEADHVFFCDVTHNGHAVHLDAVASRATRQGKVLVVSTYLFSVLVGIATADMLQEATHHLDFDAVRHVAPVFHGDTIYAESTVLAKELASESDATGIVSFETRGYKADGTLAISFRHRVAVRRAAHAGRETSRSSTAFEEQVRAEWRLG
jgi:acyl dehydratase